MWWIIILGIIGYLLLWGLTSSLLYKFFNPYTDSGECVILGSMFPLTFPVVLVIWIFNVLTNYLKTDKSFLFLNYRNNFMYVRYQIIQNFQ